MRHLLMRDNHIIETPSNLLIRAKTGAKQMRNYTKKNLDSVEQRVDGRKKCFLCGICLTLVSIVTRKTVSGLAPIHWAGPKGSCKQVENNKKKNLDSVEHRVNDFLLCAFPILPPNAQGRPTLLRPPAICLSGPKRARNRCKITQRKT